MIDPTEDMEVGCCGRSFAARRTLDLVRRFEARLGACQPFARRLEAGEATLVEIATAYAELLKGQLDEPTRGEIEAWIFTEGTPKAGRAIALPVFSLTLGNDLLSRVADRIRASGQAVVEEERDAHAPRPFVPTAGSSGPTGSPSAAKSGSAPPRRPPSPFTS